MRVLVSSTCYDLVDLRAEVEEHLRSMGLRPCLSESGTSKFEVHQDRSSIETCLENVRTAEAIVMILSQRYGAPLPDYGDISATHLEYRTAVAFNRAAAEKGLPRKQILFYVRDQLLGEIATWQHADETARRSIEFKWSTKNIGALAAFFDEHEKLRGKDDYNWRDTYRTSLDVKALLTRDFKLQANAALLARLIESGKVPAISVSAGIAAPGANGPALRLWVHGDLNLIDMSWAPHAQRPEGEDDTLGWKEQGVVVAGVGSQAGTTLQLTTDATPQTIRIRYRTAYGHRIEDTILVHTRPMESPRWVARLARRRLIDGTYEVG